MKKTFVVVTSLLLMLVFIVCVKPACAAEAQFALKFTMVGGLTWTDYKYVFAPWAQELEKATNGRVKITFYPSESMGKARDQYDLVERGTAHLTNAALAWTPGRFPLSTVFEVPLGLPSSKVGGRVAWDLFNKYLYKEFPGVKVLSFKTTEPQHLFTTKTPVRTLEDIKGLRIRISGARVIASVRALGASPLNIPGNDAADALQKGMAEGTITSDESLTGYAQEDLVHYRTESGITVLPIITIMNLKTWNSLPPDIQKVVEVMTGPSLNERTAAAYAHEVQVSQEVQKKKGIEFIQLSAAERKRWNEKLKPVADAWITDMESKGLPGRQVFEEAVALIQKYSK